MYRINLVTTSDITEFTNICQNIDGRVELFCKKNGYRVMVSRFLAVLQQWNLKKYMLIVMRIFTIRLKSGS